MLNSVFFTDIADDYIHVSATLSSLSADDSTANKKWVYYTVLFHDFYANTYSVFKLVSNDWLWSLVDCDKSVHELFSQLDYYVFMLCIYVKLYLPLPFLFLRHLEKLSDLFEKLRVSRTKTLLFIFVLICKSIVVTNLCVFLQKVEGRVASDQELKLTELLRYYMRDIQAAKVRHICHLPSSCMHTLHIAYNQPLVICHTSELGWASSITSSFLIKDGYLMCTLFLFIYYWCLTIWNISGPSVQAGPSFGRLWELQQGFG